MVSWTQFSRNNVELRRLPRKKNRWDDHYARQARDQKWLARSVFKLQEIDTRFRIIAPGARLLDLGCYPGSWSQYGVQRVGPKGEVVGIDLKPPRRFSSPNFRFIEADVLLLEVARLKDEIGARDVVLSDLAPRTTGIRLADESRSLELAERALEIALALLKKNGHFLCKVFEGEGLKAFRDGAARYFRKMRTVRPSAVRKGSREVYIVGSGFRGLQTAGGKQ